MEIILYLVYVDESGDVGLQNSPTPYFLLSALVVHESSWKKLLDDVIHFRRNLREHYDLKLREEIHSAQLFSKPKKLARIPKHTRLQICKKTIDFQENLDYISLVNVVTNKSNKPPEYDVFTRTWTVLLQRIHNTIDYGNFPGSYKEKAIIIPDKTEDKKLTMLLRKMRRYNPVPNEYDHGYRRIEIDTIIEDPYTKDSIHSFIHQLVDVNAYFLYQTYNPSKYIKKKKGHNFFYRYDNILCKVASRKNELGIVEI